MTKAKPMYDIMALRSKQAKPSDVVPLIIAVLEDNDMCCWLELEDYLINPSKTGKVTWDRYEALKILLAYDSRLGGRIKRYLDETHMPLPSLDWIFYNKVLPKLGLKTYRGRVVGELEYKPQEPQE